MGSVHGPIRQRSLTGPSILRYLTETAKTYGVDRHIRFGLKVVRASWRCEDARWALEIDGPDGEKLEFPCNFLFLCAGYYEYAHGYMQGWPGMERFKGRIVHPQAWPDDLDLAGKRIVVIGSGATAVTLIPAMAGTAAHVTMLQRSPTYVVSRPVEGRCRRPACAYAHFAAPARALARAVEEHSPADVFLQPRPPEAGHGARRNSSSCAGGNWDPASTPPRCSASAAILGTSASASFPTATCWRIRSGKASVVTDEIETFANRPSPCARAGNSEPTSSSPRRASSLRLMGSSEIVVDGETVDIVQDPDLQGRDVRRRARTSPRLFGYTNASWTLQMRPLGGVRMPASQPHGPPGLQLSARPRPRDASIGEDATLPLSSGYVQRARALLPRQGSKQPWRMNQNYALDLLAFRFGALEDDGLEFRRRDAIRDAA